MLDQHGVIEAIDPVALAVLGRPLSAALGKPFWHDELFTVLISQMPLSTMYRAAADGIDLAPPLNTALTRVVHGIGVVGIGMLPRVNSYRDLIRYTPA